MMMNIEHMTSDQWETNVIEAEESWNSWNGFEKVKSGKKYEEDHNSIIIIRTKWLVYRTWNDCVRIQKFILFRYFRKYLQGSVFRDSNRKFYLKIYFLVRSKNGEIAIVRWGSQCDYVLESKIETFLTCNSHVHLLERKRQ